MVTDWLDVDYTDPDRPPAMQAPAGTDWQDLADTADELAQVETSTGVLVAMRCGLTTWSVGAETIRADLDVEADAHADYARIRAEITGDPVHRLQAAGAWLTACRAELAHAMAYVADTVRTTVPGYVSEKRAAELAGVDRMTVRKALGKR